MDTITFEVGDTTIQLVNGEALFWTNGTDHEPDVVVLIDSLQAALSTARMLRKHDTPMGQLYGVCATPNAQVKAVSVSESSLEPDVRLED